MRRVSSSGPPPMAPDPPWAPPSSPWAPRARGPNCVPSTPVCSAPCPMVRISPPSARSPSQEPPHCGRCTASAHCSARRSSSPAPPGVSDDMRCSWHASGRRGHRDHREPRRTRRGSARPRRAPRYRQARRCEQQSRWRHRSGRRSSTRRSLRNPHRERHSRLRRACGRRGRAPSLRNTLRRRPQARSDDRHLLPARLPGPRARPDLAVRSCRHRDSRSTDHLARRLGAGGRRGHGAARTPTAWQSGAGDVDVAAASAVRTPAVGDSLDLPGNPGAGFSFEG